MINGKMAKTLTESERSRQANSRRAMRGLFAGKSGKTI
jgi:hypothetical protein